MFAVPSSDPPSTPDSRRASHGHSQAPSTTPAEPPPTGYTNQSFTPAGRPPASSLVGAASFNYADPNAFAFSSNMATFAPHSAAFAVPSSPPQRYMDGNMMDMMGDGGDMGDEYSNYAEADDDMDAMFGIRQPAFSAAAANSLPSKHAMVDFQTESPRALKRSRYGRVMNESLHSSRAARLESRQPAMPAIAKGLSTPSPSALKEPGDVILKTEQLLSSLDASVTTQSALDPHLLLHSTASQLTDLWRKHLSTQSLSGGIGPKNRDSPFETANYLASLLLRLYHPFISQHNPRSASNPFAQSSSSVSLVLQRDAVATIPRSLLDWLNTYHNPFPQDLPEVLGNRPAPIAHEKYWDMVYATTLRGDLATAISLLEAADFTQADTAMDDGYDEPGYQGRQADAAHYVTSRCIDLLRSCPAYTDDDWDVKNAEWAIFRNRVRREIQHLEAFAESDSKDRDTAIDGSNVFQSSAMGSGRGGMSFSTASRRAESKVPWTVYQNLKILYGQLQGLKDEIAVCTQDWLETAIFMTVWWDGDDDDQLPGTASRHSLRPSHQVRSVDVSPTSSYRRQLLFAFATITDDPEDTVFAVNTMDPLQVGLACICEEDIEGVVGILRGWSLPIAVAVVDIASAGGWLPQGRAGAQGLLDGFDQDDLMVLSHGQPNNQDSLSRDQVLTAYADILAKEDSITSSDGKTSKEGWDMACRVLSRLDDLDAAQRKIGAILADIPLDSAERVDKLLAVCIDIGLPEQVRAIAERYADTLAETSQSYGSALIYYARAHSQQKLKSTIDLLISMCLVQSAAFPPRSSLDPQLDMILNDQRAAITKLARVDPEAAQLIANYLSGYATLRRFYDLRDAAMDASTGTAQPSGPGRIATMKPHTRRREAAKALVALIESAADSIRGGLYDADNETVLQVDTLMALLCEALPLLNHRTAVLKAPQLLVLLRAVEDLQSVTPLVYDQAEALFRSTVQNYCESPSHLIASQDLAKSVMLSKSTTILAASSYGMIGSDGSLLPDDANSKVEVQRGWDWRAGAAHLGKSVKGEEMMRVLRTQVAKEMATAWMQV
ncbi:hypothetical protein AAFC00_000094 [Neodothiora populina]|uniref:Nuclear pore complex protein Nup85 n=1 Tax=Neodothiora populina TaxID=2781224 RepID=A0ABR3P1R0_9PEZI